MNHTPRGLGFVDRTFRRAVVKHLANISQGEIALEDSIESLRFGQPHDLSAGIRVQNLAFYRSAALGGTLAAAESYLQSEWDCDDLTSLFRIFVRTRTFTGKLDGPLARLASLGHRLFHWWHNNSRAGSRRNISAHYDLGNEFYRLWLDESLAYSSGIFAVPNASMKSASLEKFDRICRKLDLQPSDQLVEIGTGWGGFAIHAAANYGCHVTTTTISRQQFDVAQERISAAGLANRIKLLDQDYRDLTGQFDKLVSIEMIEAVGYHYFDTYFRKCSQLLRPDGSFVLQAIVMPERGYEGYVRSVDFIQRYVFPGGCLPSLGTILNSVGRTTDLRFVHAEDFAPHYAETLRRWRTAFHEQLSEVRRLGCAERFIRLWHYYLCYCEAAFEERHIGVLQIQFDKPACRRDPLQIGVEAAAVRLHSRSHQHESVQPAHAFQES